MGLRFSPSQLGITGVEGTIRFEGTIFYVKETVGQHVFQLVTNKVVIVYATTARSVTLLRLGD